MTEVPADKPQPTRPPEPTQPGHYWVLVSRRNQTPEWEIWEREKGGSLDWTSTGTDEYWSWDYRHFTILRVEGPLEPPA